MPMFVMMRIDTGPFLARRSNTSGTYAHSTTHSSTSNFSSEPVDGWKDAPRTPGRGGAHGASGASCYVRKNFIVYAPQRF